MKRLFMGVAVVFGILGLHLTIWGAPILNQPVDHVEGLFLSGDEFFSYLHDSDGNIVVESEQGEYVYADFQDGKLIPTDYAFGTNRGIVKTCDIPSTFFETRRQRRQPTKSKQSRSSKVPPTTKGELQNLTVFVDFADTTFTNQDDIKKRFQGETASLKDYYKKVSYDKLTIESYFVSYVDQQTKDYYMPKTSINTTGYDGDIERNMREQKLVEEALKSITLDYQGDFKNDFDTNNDGYIDMITFVVNASANAGTDLIWPHNSSYDYPFNSKVNDLEVIQYTMVNYNSTTTIISHEIFHQLGAPDLYHYISDGITPVGQWDIMGSSNGHMSAYMKWRYGGWIDEIPTISQHTTYQLNSLDKEQGNAFKIDTWDGHPNEYIIVEYRNRDNTDEYERTLNSSGLLIYRINELADGDGNRDGATTGNDEVYIFRPGGSATLNGQLNEATFCANLGRTISTKNRTQTFYQTSNGSIHANTFTGISIYNVSRTDQTISFELHRGVSAVEQLLPPTSVTPPGVSYQPQLLTFTNDEYQSDIFYSLQTYDNLVGTEFTKYTQPIEITQPTIVKAYRMKEGYIESAETTFVYLVYNHENRKFPTKMPGITTYEYEPGRITCIEFSEDAKDKEVEDGEFIELFIPKTESLLYKGASYLFATEYKFLIIDDIFHNVPIDIINQAFTSFKLVCSENAQFRVENVVRQTLTEKPVLNGHDTIYYQPTVITIPEIEGLDIYYTTDGSYPTYKSHKYQDGIFLDKSTVIRAVYYQGIHSQGMISDTIVYQVYPDGRWPVHDSSLMIDGKVTYNYNYSEDIINVISIKLSYEINGSGCVTLKNEQGELFAKRDSGSGVIEMTEARTTGFILEIEGQANFVIDSYETAYWVYKIKEKEFWVDGIKKSTWIANAQNTLLLKLENYAIDVPDISNISLAAFDQYGRFLSVGVGYVDKNDIGNISVTIDIPDSATDLRCFILTEELSPLLISGNQL